VPWAGPAVRGLACGRVEPGLTNRVPGLPFGKTRDVPNLVSLIALAGVAAAETDRYLWTEDLEDSGEAPRPRQFRSSLTSRRSP
jgi:hypothetical protein